VLQKRPTKYARIATTTSVCLAGSYGASCPGKVVLKRQAFRDCAVVSRSMALLAGWMLAENRKSKRYLILVLGLKPHIHHRPNGTETHDPDVAGKRAHVTVLASEVYLLTCSPTSLFLPFAAS
jgi:hypothetical protein